MFCLHLVLNLAQQVRFQFYLVLGQKAFGFDSSNENQTPKINFFCRTRRVVTNLLIEANSNIVLWRFHTLRFEEFSNH